MTTQTADLPASSLSTRRAPFIRLIEKEKLFLAILASTLILIGIVYPYASIARWIGFAIAGYSAVANDSVQTLGTFIGSNRDRPWWHLWMWIGGIFLLTVGYSWYNYSGDVTFQRLASKGFDTTPMSFTFLQVAAPLVLLGLTRGGIPVSTTLLLLSCFATEPASIGKVLTKSFLGYGVAFGVAIVVWLSVSKMIDRWQQGPPAKAWRVAQWCTTGVLWSVWLMQDMSNVAVFLPRSLSVIELLAFAGVIFFGLGFMFKMGGERVQKIVDEKARVTDVRAATIVDLVYAVVLYVFKMESNIPMSTTWVFIGLLAGREIAMTIRGASGGTKLKHAFRLAGKDLFYVTIGLVISVAIAFAANASLAQSLSE